MPHLTPELRKLLQGTPFGEVFPDRASPPPTAVDGRTIALRILKKYIANLIFYRPMGQGRAPEPFQIPERAIHIDWPDREEDLTFPSIVMLSASKAEYKAIGLTGYVEEDSRDKYGRGTVVQWQSEYTEMISLEIWTSKKPEQRSVLAGLEIALTPTEQMYGIRFKMPDYFNELVCFTLFNRQMFSEPDAARDRRRVHLEIEMRHNVVALVNYVEIQPTVKVETDVDLDTNIPLVVESPETP